jgi:hypothetical protein
VPFSPPLHKILTEELLEGRLHALNVEIGKLRDQQAIVIKILKSAKLIKKSRIMNKEIWVGLLRAAGLDEAGMRKWHKEFEKVSPEAHKDFLESLRLSKKEVGHIRRWSKEVRIED